MLSPPHPPSVKFIRTMSSNVTNGTATAGVDVPTFLIQTLRAKVRWSCRLAQTTLTYYPPLLKKGIENSREAGEAGR